MAVPKRKVSKARRDKRRSSHWKLETPGIVTCPKCGAYRLPHPDVQKLPDLQRPFLRPAAGGDPAAVSLGEKTASRRVVFSSLPGGEKPPKMCLTFVERSFIMLFAFKDSRRRKRKSCRGCGGNRYGLFTLFCVFARRTAFYYSLEVKPKCPTQKFWKRRRPLWPS